MKESKKKRLLIAFAFFVILPATYQLTTDLVGFDKSATPQPSPTAVQATNSNPETIKPSCLQIRTEAEDLEAASKKERNDELNTIYSKQRKYLLRDLELLHQANSITDVELENIRKLISLATSDGAPLSPFLDEYLQAERTFETLLKNNLVEPYFAKDVISLGNQLASRVNPSLLIKRDNPECFEKWEVDFALSLLNIDVKSAWGEKKRASDFVQVLTWRKR